MTRKAIVTGIEPGHWHAFAVGTVVEEMYVKEGSGDVEFVGKSKNTGKNTPQTLLASEYEYLTERKVGDKARVLDGKSHFFDVGEIVTLQDAELGGGAYKFYNGWKSQWLEPRQVEFIAEEAPREAKRLGKHEPIPTAVLEVMAQTYEELGYDGEAADIEAELQSRYDEEGNY